MVDVPRISPEYATSRPPASLSALVECLWTHRTGAATDRRILPDGRVDLVWIRGEGAVLAGPQSRATERPDRPFLLAYGARFHPGVAPSLFGVAAHEMLNDHVPLPGIDPSFARRLDRRLEAADGIGTAFVALSVELRRLIARTGPPDPAVLRAARLLAADVRVADLVADLHLSERTIQRRFDDHIGYGPKTFQRVLRFQRAVDAVSSGHGLADSAALAGYADQAHLARDCRRLSGLTPGELAKWVG